jgi:hypothetical protein
MALTAQSRVAPDVHGAATAGEPNGGLSLCQSFRGLNGSVP